MSKQSKKHTKRNKSEQKIKKTKARKLGLAKFIHPTTKRSEASTITGPSIDEKINFDKHESNIKSSDKGLSLLERCKKQMSSSLLRLMDEDVYTSDARSASLGDKEKFLAYHDAYATVCEKWPTKPIDYIVRFIKRRLLTKKNHYKIKFADIGCGREPLLKMKLPPKTKVQSFDLVSTHKDVIQANMESLPIEDESIDCAVYSLSLMAKNLGNVLLEGKRILKMGGSLLIVEVSSRFEDNVKKFIGKVERLGLKQKSTSSLRPNGYFTFFHFTKVDSKADYSDSCLNIQLKACVYKSR